jgi:hypothetical protein
MLAIRCHVECISSDYNRLYTVASNNKTYCWPVHSYNMALTIRHNRRPILGRRTWFAAHLLLCALLLTMFDSILVASVADMFHRRRWRRIDVLLYAMLGDRTGHTTGYMFSDRICRPGFPVVMLPVAHVIPVPLPTWPGPASRSSHHASRLLICAGYTSYAQMETNHDMNNETKYKYLP